MGFRNAKKQVLECLDNGHIQHVLERSNIDVKNRLATGEVSAEQIANIIGRARGSHYESSLHHFDESIEVHIITIRHGGQRWYIKWYYLEPDVVFISVH